MDYKLTDIERILKFWFGEITDGLTVEDRNEFWFMANNQTDIKIKNEFEHLVIKAGDGKLSWWEGSAKGSLALIILLDQFPRNIYRGTPKAFQFDEYASRICKQGLLEEKDKDLELIQRCFYYLPLEHSEDIKDQDMCVALYQNMKESAKKQHLKQIEYSLKYAEIHRDIIKKFGRFPHRNKILSRNTTKAELEFLSKEATSFGQ
jgi:uncharacterized protein (DUF924 family)